MMTWSDVLKTARNNPEPPKRIERTTSEWKQILTPEQFRVTRQHGTEMPFSGEYCEAYEPGIYTCVCCGTALFDSTLKYDSRTGWPSFKQPVKSNVVKYKLDNSFGMERVEVLCNVCDAHLGHVFPDGPPPSGLRFCINSVSLHKEERPDDAPGRVQTATLGGGCFWCTEAIMNELAGIINVISGYSGGKESDATYRLVSSGTTDHAESVQIQFNPEIMPYGQLLKIFLATHDPTSLNRQGADVGRQYRSVIFYHDESQHETAQKIISEMQDYYDKPIITEVVPFQNFHIAEEVHRDFYRNNPEQAYCRLVITPKLRKLRESFSDSLRKTVSQD